MQHYQLAVIGSGAGGAEAAQLAAARGLRVVVCEQGQLGGTCLHAGCIPVKSLMVDAARLGEMERAGQTSGEFLLAEWMSHQRRAIAKLTEHLRIKLVKAGATILQGRAELRGPHEIRVSSREGQHVDLTAEIIILATGAHPRMLPELPRDAVVGPSDDFINITKLPRSLAIIGGGHIGCEFASIFSALGAQVTLVEARSALLNDMPGEAGAFLQRRFTDAGIDVRLNEPVTPGFLERTPGGARLHLRGGPVEVERVLIAAGRIPNSHGLGLEPLGIYPDPRIPVDDRLRTTVPHIYAVGDVNGMLPMAHAAVAQGRLAVRNALGEDLRADFTDMPVCVYTLPEIAQVGLTAAEALDRGIRTVSGRSQFTYSARALALGGAEGFVDLLAEAGTGRLLGALVIGTQAGELISQLALALRLRATMADLASVNYPHPTFSEAIQDAAMAVS